jgi:GNAT superfamily N-acetyltransferase
MNANYEQVSNSPSNKLAIWAGISLLRRKIMINQQEFTIRLGNPDTDDYERFAELLRIIENRGTIGDNIREFDTNQLEGDFIRRYAACLGETVIGYGTIFCSNTNLIPRYSLWAGIYPEYRGNGYGARLYNHISKIAQEQGATQFYTSCMDNDPLALKFAKKRGFELRHHTFESVLNIETFDETPFTYIIEKLEKQGIRFTSLAAEGNSEEAQYKLWVLNDATAQDETSRDSSSKSNFETFKARIVNAHWFRADGQLLAVDGDRYVGLGAIGFEPDGVTANNAFTGVDREYRGRKIAQALKLHGIHYAKSKGVKRIITDNDSKNVGMLAINDKLGYVRQPGYYRFINKHI